MSTEQGFAPESEQFLSADQLNDPDVKLIFVQHGPKISTNQAIEAYTKSLEKSTTSKITITRLPAQTPVYPVSFGDNKLHVSRKVDQFIIATPTV